MCKVIRQNILYFSKSYIRKRYIRNLKKLKNALTQFQINPNNLRPTLGNFKIHKLAIKSINPMCHYLFNEWKISKTSELR